jgi:hypothetical protein
MTTRRDQLVDFLARRCASLCMDDAADRERLAELLLGFGALAPEPAVVLTAIRESIGTVHAQCGPDLDQMARNAAQVVLAAFVE